MNERHEDEKISAELEVKTKYIASCSFGKDSVATILLALEHGEPIDEILYCEVMFDQNTSGEVPEHRDFIYETAIPYFERAGIKTIVIRGKKTFVELFQRVVGDSGRYSGKIWSWPLCGRCYVQRDCKARPLEAHKKAAWRNVIQYIGYANDEMTRLARLDGRKTISLLEKYGIDASGARDICKAHGLYSPIYDFSRRNGCFFCPNAKPTELRHLYDHHPELWAELLRLQALPNKATEKFNREERFCDIDENFRIDDAQFDLFGKPTVPFDVGRIRDFNV